jgi:hypothetical protein
LKLDDFTSDTTLVGYIFGGIHSSAANIFWMNDGSQSSAGSQIFKIYIVKNSKSGNHKLNQQSIGTLHLQVYPDIENQNFEFHFNLEHNSEVTLSIGDANGRILQSSVLRNLNPGKNAASLNMMNLSEGAYFISIETTYEKAEQKIIIEP